MTRHFLMLTFPIVASLLLLASSACAQDPGADLVTLKNGGTIRGTVISSEPGTSVKILEMGSREPRGIPWAQVSDVERGKYAPAGAAQPGPAGPAPTPLAPPGPQLGALGVIRLHIDSPVPAQVLEHAGTAYAQAGGYGVVINQFRPVCISPCDTVIDGSQGQEFGLAGGFPSPRAFQTVGLTGDYKLTLEPGSRGLRVGGVVAVSLGLPTLITGAVLLPIGSSIDGASTLKNAGIGALVGGVALLGGGIGMIVASRSKYALEKVGGARPTARAPRYWLGEF